jgi:type IV pilus assembly protein PilV
MLEMRTLKRARGFSLVEVMAAVVIICVGLLGIAKMQALSLSNANTSRMRALAAIQAASLAASMHSNREYWANVVGAPYTVTINPAAAPIVQSGSDAAMAATASGYVPAGFGNNACLGGNNQTPMCSNVTNPGQLAAFDLALWTNALTALLPNPTASIQCTNSIAVNLPTSCTIQINWTEKAVAMTQQAAQYQASNGQQQFELPSYVLYVEP